MYGTVAFGNPLTTESSTVFQLLIREFESFRYGTKIRWHELIRVDIEKIGGERYGT
jgi:hypothetical protein